MGYPVAVTLRRARVLRATYAVSALACVALLAVLVAALLAKPSITQVVDYTCLAAAVAVPLLAGVVALVVEEPSRGLAVSIIAAAAIVLLVGYDFASVRGLISVSGRAVLGPLGVIVGVVALGSAAMFVADLLGVARMTAAMQRGSADETNPRDDSAAPDREGRGE